MGLKTIIIHQNKYLHHILSEISKTINCKIIHTDHFNLNFSEFKFSSVYVVVFYLFLLLLRGILMI